MWEGAVTIADDKGQGTGACLTYVSTPGTGSLLQTTIPGWSPLVGQRQLWLRDLLEGSSCLPWP